MAKRDYYEVLGVPKSADADTIKKAYRKLAMKHHPDQKPGDKVAEEKFKAINEANEVLSNPDKRKRYDEFGENWEYMEKSGGQPFQQQQQRGGGGRQYEFTAADFEDDAHYRDIFEKFFGGGFRGGFGGQRFSQNQPSRGHDQEAELQISLAEAFHGTKRVIGLETGRIAITLKRGTADGQKIRLREKGAPGQMGGKNGDLFITIRIAPDPSIERNGDDLTVKMNVDLYSAILGGQVTLNTFHGPKKVNIKPGADNGSTLRLKSLGMPKYSSTTEFGDLFAKINLVLPKNLTEKEQSLFRQLAEMRPAQTA